MTFVHRLMDVYERYTAEQIAVSPVDPRGVLFSIGMAQLKAEAVAEQSGGEAFYNNNDVRSQIAKAINHGAQFYTLSYVPPKQKDDSHYHHIKVELVDQPGLHLVYRQGYNAERVPTLDVPAPGPVPYPTQPPNRRRSRTPNRSPARPYATRYITASPPARSPSPKALTACCTARSSSMLSPTIYTASVSRCSRRPFR
jgi:hypothetical protein